MVDLLSADEIAQRVRSQRSAVSSPTPPVVTPTANGAGATTPAPESYRYYNPLVNAAHEWAHGARNADHRVRTGIDEFDYAMRGLGSSELLQISGHSHQGKSQVVNNIVAHNSKRRIVYFSPDETRQLVLLKLAALTHGISAEELESRVADGDDEAERLVVETAEIEYPRLAVFDEVDELDQMSSALAEAEDVWGQTAELVIFDYLDLLRLADGDVGNRFKAIKAWGKRHNVPLVVLHQTSRSAGASGQEITLSSGAYGGEAASTFIIGVRRKRTYWKAVLADLREKESKAANPSERLREQIADAEYELTNHEGTITVNLVKSKRPPSRLVDDLDFDLDPNTGRLLRRDAAFSRSSTTTWDEQELTWEAF